MFTGIIETLGIIKNMETQQDNMNVTVSSSLTHELKIDQSLAHNGICLTVIDINDKEYTVTAISETIAKTNLSEWRIGDEINLERAMKLGDRLDGHIVQGHVDQKGNCTSFEETNGSWYFTFEYDPSLNNITIEKAQ